MFEEIYQSKIVLDIPSQSSSAVLISPTLQTWQAISEQSHHEGCFPHATKQKRERSKIKGERRQERGVSE
jgi:hypothetical protein